MTPPLIPMPPSPPPEPPDTLPDSLFWRRAVWALIQLAWIAALIFLTRCTIDYTDPQHRIRLDILSPPSRPT